MAYDANHGKVVLFGGDYNFQSFNDTWLWDGSNWVQQSPSTSPGPRSGASMTYDSAHTQVILFGGSDETGALNDTWVWDGQNWSQKSPQTSPPPRSNSAMAYDSVHDQTVVFGGANGTTGLNDTWLWDGTNWTPAAPAASPSARTDMAMAFDVAPGYVVMFGGLDQNRQAIGETWLWDGANWTQASPQDSPSARYGEGMTYDAGHDDVVMFGGTGVNGITVDTWLWNGGPVTPVIAAVVNGASFAKGGVAPGEIATAFGTNLTSSTGINLTSGLPLPTTYLTDSLTVNNKPVALFAVDNSNGQQQINFQVPWEVANGPNATVVVSNGGTASASISVPVVAAQPGIFNYSAGGNTFGAILHANFALANTANPAKPGETVLIYCTGLGAVESPPEDGAAGNGQHTLLNPEVSIGGTKAMVSFSGLAPGFVGLYQINAEVPAELKAGNQPVAIEAGGASSTSVLLPVN